jgi:cytochrome c oxidase cbb3-type subunit I
VDLKENLPLRFMAFGAIAYLLAAVLGIFDSFPPMGRITRFTFFTPGLTQLFLYGFFSMTMFGAIYYIVPRLMQDHWPSASLPKRHLTLAMLGTVLYVAPLVIGGVVQGLALNDANKPFADVSRSSLMFFRVSTLGALLLAAGNFLLAWNLGWLLVRRYRVCCAPRRATTIGSAMAEVTR